MCLFFDAALGPAPATARKLMVPEAFDADKDHHTECEAPSVYMPEHRWRVEEPREGAVAGSVRAVFEDMSRVILVGASKTSY